jgi:hypothetical protein
VLGALLWTVVCCVVVGSVSSGATSWLCTFQLWTLGHVLYSLPLKSAL